MRYKGQEHTVKVPIKTGTITKDDLSIIIERFHEYHEHAYSFRLPGSPVEIVNFHGMGVAKVVKPKLREIELRGVSLDDAVKEDRTIYVAGKEMTVPVYDRVKIPREVEGEGPAVIEDPTSTVLVLENQRFLRDKFGNIIITFAR
jgi:N-methylhydantoinase A